jgi:AbrB family looped-hinge helix DNA binding protein
MRTTIDKAGRVVVPKALRDQVGLRPGAEVDIEVDGLALRLEPVVGDGPRIGTEHGFPVIRTDGVVVTDDEIVTLRDALRR